MHNAVAQKVNINRRTLQAVLRINPALAGGRSTADFKDFLENGGSLALGNDAAKTNMPTPEASQTEANDERVQFEQALGFSFAPKLPRQQPPSKNSKLKRRKSKLPSSRPKNTPKPN